MRSFVAFIMKSRMHAVVFVAVLVLVSLQFPRAAFPLGLILGSLTSLLASSVVGLATLRNGLTQGVLVAALATLLSGVVAVGSMGVSVLLLQGMLMLTWIPVVLLCELLRRSANQGAAREQQRVTAGR